MDGSLISLLIIVIVLVALLLLVTRLSKPKLNKHHFQRKWEHIENESNLNMAVIKADSLLDEALRHSHVRGSTMGERLNNSKGLINDINATWSAHKLRNKLVHETNEPANISNAKRALVNFKKALRDLGAL